MIPIAKPLLGEEEKRAVLDVLDSGMLAQGKKVTEFEKAFAEFIGVKQAIATSNGTTALHTALLAHGISPGDEVITTPFSFIATANAIRMVGATPVFVDIEETTFNLDPNLIGVAITPRTKAIIPVHLFGRPAEMDKIMEVAGKHNLIVIEDACQAHGAEFQGRKVGSFGTGCFSFYATKNMTTGEGGMITTNDGAVAERARKIIDHGSEKKYYHEVLGYNHRLTDIGAALGIEQLKRLPLFNQKRRENARYLSQQLALLPGIVIPDQVPGHVFHLYSLLIRSKPRDQVVEVLGKAGISAAPYYPVPIHRQKAYGGHNRESFPITEQVTQETLSLPVHPALGKEELDKIIQAMRGIFTP